MAVSTARVRTSPKLRRSARSGELAELRRLWGEQQAWASSHEMADPAGQAYLAAHLSLDVTLERHLRVLDGLTPHVRGRVLEWGCRHGLDACVYRMRLGSAIELHGCDVCDGEDYRPFFQNSGLIYKRLDHPWRLPYASDHFDTVTSNGVLEHVPDDRASLRELYRILKPGGTLAITCLPNRWSYTEAIQRARGGTSHDRLYTLSGTTRMLREAGYEVRRTGRFLMLPTMLNGFPKSVKAAYNRAGGVVWGLNDAMERVWPIRMLASNLMLIATKPEDPGGSQ